MIITVETNKLVSKTISNAEYVLLETIQLDTDNEVVDYYDGETRWYKVQKYVNGCPMGCKYFGPDYNKAYNYFKKVK